MTLVINIEQYDKGDEWRTLDLHCRKVVPLLKCAKNKNYLHFNHANYVVIRKTWELSEEIWF